MNYATIASRALAQINDKGRAVTLRAVTQGTYSAASDALTGNSTADASIKAVITDLTEKDDDFGDLVERGDMKALIAASGLSAAPKPADVLLDGSTQYRIINVLTVKPGSTALLYKLQLRR